MPGRIIRAKQSKTRAARIEKYRPRTLQGKGIHDRQAETLIVLGGGRDQKYQSLNMPDSVRSRPAGWRRPHA